MSYAWALVAALTVTGSETIFTSSPSWIGRAWLFVPLALLANWTIYRLVHSVPTLLDAFIVFSFMTMLLRIGSTTLILRQPVPCGTWVATALIVLAKLTQSVWR